MTTRFRLPASGAAPVSPAIQAYTHTQATRRPLPTSDATALATQAYTPDAADHGVAGDAHHVQCVGAVMQAGNVFTSGDLLKMAIQGLEAHANNNLNLQLFVSVVSQDGATQRAVLRSKVEHATEWTTALINRFLSTTLSGSYTTVSGDRLVVELSVEGTPGGGGGVQGHNSSLRWGSNGAGGDLPENDTEAGTTFNPWIEFLTTINFGLGGPIGQAEEQDSAQVVGRVKSVTLGQASEQDLAQPITRKTGQEVTIGQALEQDTAQPIGRAKSATLGQAQEQDAAQAIGRVKSVVIGQAGEQDTAQPIGRLKSATVGQASEQDLAQVLTPRKARTIGLAQEQDAAQALTVVGGAPVIPPSPPAPAPTTTTAGGVILGTGREPEFQSGHDEIRRFWEEYVKLLASYQQTVPPQKVEQLMPRELLDEQNLALLQIIGDDAAMDVSDDDEDDIWLVDLP